jgi:bifunctional non-homologous end joining protein LigD
MKYEPMLAKIGEKSALSSRQYCFEPKLDGTRAVLYAKAKSLEFINRRGRNISYRYPEFKNFHEYIYAESCVLDGEIIVYDENGFPQFNLLQMRDQLEKKAMIEIRSRELPATFVVFDILEKNRKPLFSLPYLKRKKILEQTVRENEHLELCFYTDNGKQLWKQVRKAKLEGVMAKRRGSHYAPGKRTHDWLKIKNLKTIDIVIVGFSHEKRIISALCMALYKEGKLYYIGRVGTGFTEKFLNELCPKLKKVIQKRIPVENPPKNWEKHNIKWLRPVFVAEVRYLELSKDRILRAPAFLRMRYDKPAKDCAWEFEQANHNLSIRPFVLGILPFIFLLIEHAMLSALPNALKTASVL